MDRGNHRRWAPAPHWVAVGVLAALCGVVAILQYRWIGEISAAERTRLQAALRERLSRVQRSFDYQIRGLTNPLVPDADEISALGREAAYEARYAPWRAGREGVFSNIALVIPRDGNLEVEMLALDQGRFISSEWPPDWADTKEYLRRKLSGPSSSESPDAMVLEIPRFGPEADGRAREQEWLVLELDRDYVRGKLIPAIARRELSEGGSVVYDVVVASRGPAAEKIYESSPGLQLEEHADASVTLLDSGPGLIRARRGKGPGGPKGPPPGESRRKGPPPDEARAEGPRSASLTQARPGKPPFGDSPSAAGGRWVLLARHRAGSLEALVEQTRKRNLAVSGGLLLLILGTAAALVRYSRQAQQLAETRMNFVAGVSHELRTPLTVIRTAAFNLRGRLAHSPVHVERYGTLIQNEAERLSALMEQVLLFASAKTGSILRKLEPVSVESLIESSLRAARISSQPGLVIEKKITPFLPPLMADEVALSHALTNLVDNAIKHGAVSEPWIGISAGLATGDHGLFVEITVSDRGPGIPAEEQASVFEPFYRGRRAIDDQIHGTGLGLDLVKKIVEAHGGSIRVTSVPLERTEFVMRLPASSKDKHAQPEPETENEFAHPAD